MSDSEHTRSSDSERTRSWEYWNTYIFEFPAYIRMLVEMLIRRVSFTGLAKANWGLDHGGFVFCSKYSIQSRLDPDYAIPSALLKVSDETVEQSLEHVDRFLQSPEVDYPLILKPDNGRIGKGIVKVATQDELREVRQASKVDLVAQPYCKLPEEYGVFFYRLGGEAKILNINSKELPYVVGDGQSSLRELIQASKRLPRFLDIFSKEIDLTAVPSEGESVRLSYVGNHAQGAVFRDASSLASPALIAALERALEDLPGINYGRFDLMTASAQALKEGHFKIIEFNGVDSLSTCIFDPKYTIWDAYRILIGQYVTLVRVAAEHKDKEMEILPLRQLWKKVFQSESELSETHERFVKAALR